MAPVAETQASLFVALDQTFGAFARVARPYIQETISKSPATLDAANADLPVLRPFLHDSQRFFIALQPGAAALAKTSPTIAAAERAGIPALNALPTLNAQLVPTAEALLAFQNAPGVFNGLDLLIDTNHTLGPAIEFIAPAQTTCNYLTLAFKNLASATSEGNPLGNWLNFFSFELPEGPKPRAGLRRLPPTVPASKTTCTTTRTRTPPLRASPIRVKRATSATRPARP